MKRRIVITLLVAAVAGLIILGVINSGEKERFRPGPVIKPTPKKLDTFTQQSMDLRKETVLLLAKDIGLDREEPYITLVHQLESNIFPIASFCWHNTIWKLMAEIDTRYHPTEPNEAGTIKSLVMLAAIEQANEIIASFDEAADTCTSKLGGLIAAQIGIDGAGLAVMQPGFYNERHATLQEASIQELFKPGGLVSKFRGGDSEVRLEIFQVVSTLSLRPDRLKQAGLTDSELNALGFGPR